MTQAPGAEGWPSPFRIAIALLVGGLVGLYVAAYVFLMAMKLPPQNASLLTLHTYWQAYGDRPDVRRTMLAALVGAQGLTLGLVAAAMVPRRRPLHGAARFATRREIEQAGLLKDNGIILGRLGRRYLVLPGQQGVELEAPPRSGKGVGVVVPNLLNWPGSTIVSDIKGENFVRTAGFRHAHGQQVHLFDPLSERECSARWNPLGYVSEVPYRCIDDLQRIGTMLFPDPMAGDPFWTSSARSLFLGIALYLFETEGATRTLGEVLRQGMASDAEGFQKHWKRVIDACERAGYPLSQEAVQSLYDVIDLAPTTASSIRKTFTSRLDLWLNPLIDAATSANDFDLRALRKRPISIYVQINPDNVARLQPLLNLFFQQAIGLQTRELPENNPDLKLQLLLMLDEFPALGRIPVIAESTAFLPGYNVRTVVIVQSNSQLVEKYGVEGAKSIRKMLAARIVFPPKEYDDAEAISRELGTYTVRQKNISRPMWGGEGKAATVSISEQPRRLLLPQEVKELGPARMILFYEGLRPVLAHRILYFRDRSFARREVPPPAVPQLDVDGSSHAIAGAHARRAEDEKDDPEGHARRSSARAETSVRGAAHGLGQAMMKESSVASDVLNDKLALDDFSFDFDDVEIPAEKLSDEDMKRRADEFMARILD
ncbi:type IV secretory system conjugative DNA transfer family protein [Variovorax sp. J22R24]|uniref:type IV secretory system conjugative DNA transfer family protein n=1 Tax=Variovorax gracilis TaxID=3053502 RepID=UPI002575BDB2|nr:type IV secretory system conjugative DNA transfer family protein [Variovorax sp. J22R24]MDM0108022.1 type IV secretory system conjugative DNA transfer family protein [Variovorax sp. J22R24]